LLAQESAADQGWIATSSDFTKMLVNVEMRHNPESGSYRGLGEYDALVSQPALAACFHPTYCAKL
jgi:hypothetical protein